MTDYSTKYPLVGKILSEQDGLFQFMGLPSTPAELVTIQNRIADVIESSIDRTDGEKEALIVGSVIALSPPFILDDTERFGNGEYSDEVNTLVTEMLDAQMNVGAPVPTNLAQLGTAIGTVMLEDLTEKLKSGEVPEFAREQIAEGLKQSAEQQRDFVLPNLNAPRLQALFEAAKDKVEAELGQGPSSGQDNKPPAPKKPGNFDFG